MSKPIRILQVVTIMNMGGIENFLMNLYRVVDRTKVQFDFLVHRQERGIFDDEIEQLGGKIHRMQPLQLHRFFSYRSNLKDFFKKHPEYKIIHSHINESSTILLQVAKRMEIPVRIAHSHAKATVKPFRIIRDFLRRNVNSYSTLNLACSVDAGNWLFGENKFEVLANSIDTNRFKFPDNYSKRKSTREKLNFQENDFVIGSIARFSTTKNHIFLVNVFHKFLELNKDTKLLLVGDGELKNQIKKQIEELGIQNSVFFAGNVNNPEDYLSTMDLFLMTSFNEGFPVVLVEAQCNGLPILMSDTMPEEIELTELTYRKSLNTSSKDWAKSILEISKELRNNDRCGYDDIVKEKGFDVVSNSQKLVSIYLTLFNNLIKSDLK